MKNVVIGIMFLVLVGAVVGVFSVKQKLKAETTIVDEASENALQNDAINDTVLVAGHDLVDVKYRLLKYHGLDKGDYSIEYKEQKNKKGLLSVSLFFKNKSSLILRDTTK